MKICHLSQVFLLCFAPIDAEGKVKEMLHHLTSTPNVASLTTSLLHTRKKYLLMVCFKKNISLWLFFLTTFWSIFHIYKKMHLLILNGLHVLHDLIRPLTRKGCLISYSAMFYINVEKWCPVCIQRHFLIMFQYWTPTFIKTVQTPRFVLDYTLFLLDIKTNSVE